MTAAALILYVVYMAIAFGVRTIMQLRATGSTGFVGIGGRPGSLPWLAGVLFAIAIVAGFVSPLLVLTGALGLIDALDAPWLNWLGVALAVAGIALTFASQAAMGTSWRIGVDENERTELVTTGPFAHVRNPIFTAMLLAALGLALMVPTVWSMAALVALFVALELQVRIIEEPYLLAAQGEGYRKYAARTGRFLPGIGQIAS